MLAKPQMRTPLDDLLIIAQETAAEIRTMADRRANDRRAAERMASDPSRPMVCQLSGRYCAKSGGSLGIDRANKFVIIGQLADPWQAGRIRRISHGAEARSAQLPHRAGPGELVRSSDATAGTAAHRPTPMLLGRSPTQKGLGQVRPRSVGAAHASDQQLKLP